MLLNGMSFLTLSVFEAGWAFFFNFFIWEYIASNLKDFTYKRLLLVPILIIGYINIAVLVFIILAALLVLAGGYFTGYWVFDRKKGQAYNDQIEENENRKITVKLSAADREKLMQFQNESEVNAQPTYENGVIDFQNGKQVEVNKLMTADEANELIESDQMCAVCLMPFDTYENLDETQEKLKILRSKIENMIEKYDAIRASPSDCLFNHKPAGHSSSIYQVKSSIRSKQLSINSNSNFDPNLVRDRNSTFTKQGFRYYHQQCFNMEFKSEDIINLAKE